MAELKSLLRQHDDVIKVVERIEQFGSPELVKTNCFDILLAVSELSGKLSIHLTTEDRYVYPKLTNHPDARIRETGSMFQSEMGGLAAAFQKFKAQYSTAVRIGENPADFLADFALNRTALAERIDKENLVLYPLLDE